MEHFEKRYKLHTNNQLVTILSNSNEYQPEAIEAAKKELASRNIGEQELEKIYSELASKNEEEKLKLETKKRREKQLKAQFIRFFDPINPFLSGLPKFERNIRLITIVFGGIAVYQLISEFDYFTYIFTSSKAWDVTILLFLIPYIGLPIAVYLFWKRKKIGWILLLTYYLYGLVNVSFLIVFYIKYEPSGEFLFDEILLPPTSPTAFVFPLLFYVGTIWVMFGKELRKQYSLVK